VSADRRQGVKVNAFHTDTTSYSPQHREVYHDQSECHYGKEIKKDGNDIPGTAGRPRCDRCKELG
jgi:hypothetical protein